MKLSTRAIIALVNALNVFDQGAEKAEAGKRPFKLANGARMILSKNLMRVEGIVSAYQKERNAMILLHADADGKLEGKAAIEFNALDNMLMDWLHEVELVAIRETDLRLDDNDIPVTVVAGLAPVIEGAPEAITPAFAGFTSKKYQEAAAPAH